MAANTAIEWTDETWNPLAGCSPVSEGCRNCYAAKEAIRLAGNPNAAIAAKYTGTAEMRGAGRRRRAVFTGRVNLDEAALLKPLRWRQPRRVFVNSMSDLFHEAVPESFIRKVFAVMMLTPQHTYQVLTKRPDRMQQIVSGLHTWELKRSAIDVLLPGKLDTGINNITGLLPKPYQQRLHEFVNENALPHVWLGTSVEDQERADERIPHLLATPAAVRFLSCEPLLGPVEFSDVTGRFDCVAALGKPALAGIHWVIAGGESGPGARPMHPDWARSLRDQCQAAGVLFFFKQWGEWAPCSPEDWHGMGPEGTPRQAVISPAGSLGGGFLGSAAAEEFQARGWRAISRIGKKAAGRELDGRTWDEFPEVSR